MPNPISADGRVFHGPNGELRAHNDVNHAVVSAGKRIGLDVNAHQLRHSAVSLLIDIGANPRAIQAFVALLVGGVEPSSIEKLSIQQLSVDGNPGSLRR